MKQEENENLNDNQNENINNQEEENKNEERKENEIIKELRNETIKENKEKKRSLSNDNFQNIYSKINLIKQKHKQHKEIDNKTRFSLNDYQIDKVMNDNKLKELFEMLEPDTKKYNVKYNKNTDLYQTFNNKNNINNNNTNYFNLYNTNSNLEKFKNSEQGTQKNKMYNLFNEINKMNEPISPVNKFNYNQTFSTQITMRNKLDNNKISYQNYIKSNLNQKNFITNDIIDRKYEPISEVIISLPLNNYNNNNSNDNLYKTTTYLKNAKPLGKNSLNINSYNNINFKDNDNYGRTIYNITHWFGKFSGKYNSNYYNNELNKLGDAIDKVGDYSNLKSKKRRLNFKKFI